MKKLLVALVMLVVLLGGYYYYEQGRGTEKVATTTPTAVYRPDAREATFTLDDRSITLTGGRAEFQVAPGSAIVEEVSLTEWVAYGDLNGDGKEDAGVLIVESGGGSGLFIYVGALVSGPVTYKGSNLVFVGDRIAPEKVSINNGTVSVTYLDRRAGEPMAAEPTVRIIKHYSLEDGELVEN